MIERFESNFRILEAKKRYLSIVDEPLDIISQEGFKILAERFMKNPHGYLSISDLSKENCRKISLTTSCMDRNSFLLKSLETWLQFPFKEIVIVDWSSKVPVEDSIREYFDSDFLSSLQVPIKVKRIEGETYYDHSKVRNTKLDLCESEWILCIDSDVMLNYKFANYFRLKDPLKLYCNFARKSDRGLFGTAIFSKYLYKTIGKFDEDLKYWGSEDEDFYNRAKEVGFKVRDIRSFTMLHQDHSDDLRSLNTPFESIWKSLSENNYRIAKKKL